MGTQNTSLIKRVMEKVKSMPTKLNRGPEAWVGLLALGLGVIPSDLLLFGPVWVRTALLPLPRQGLADILLRRNGALQ